MESESPARRRQHCAVCGLGFSDAGNLARHMRAAHEQLRPHACAHCAAAFARRDHLRDHERIHSTTREFVCDTCGAASKSAAALRMHGRAHGPRQHACLHCGASFRRRAELTAHVSVHTGERAHACACGKAFRLRAQLTRHQRTHRDPPRFRRCEYCPLVVTGLLYNAHLLGVHANLLFHCDECDSYIPRKNFLAHMTAHAVQYDAEGRVARKPTNPNGRLYVLRPPAAPLPHTTTAAADSTTRPSKPTNTATSSTSEATRDEEDESSDAVAAEPLPPVESSAPTAPTAPNEPPTPPEPVESPEPAASPEPTKMKTRTLRQCPHCPKTYTAASSYFYHLKYTHGKSREHECATCGRRFGTRGALREHAALHESAATLQCDQCDKRFRSKAGQYIHMQTHTDVKKFACAECGRAFRWRAALRRHAARHEARRAHACECGRAFSVRADMLRHARTHRRAAHPCPHAPCRATFAQPRYLRAHVARKHPARADKPPAKRKSA